MAHRVLMAVLSLCSFGILAAESSSAPYGLRLVGGASPCEGELQVQQRAPNWTGVYPSHCNLWFGNRVCAALDCGSAVSVAEKEGPETETRRIRADCEEASLNDCFYTETFSSKSSVELKCSDSVRLRGPSLCSGSLELRWDQSWTPVCEGDFDLQDAEVVCRELGCGAPSLLQGALYGEVRALGQTFLCEGHESALMDCPRSSSGNTCSSGTAVELTCSEPVRLVGGASRCAGAVELRLRGEWRRVSYVAFPTDWDLKTKAVLCQNLDCGSAVSGEIRHDFPERPVWVVSPACVKKMSALRECVESVDTNSKFGLELVCSDSVRLRGPSLCSGSLELHQDQSWTPVCEGDFDLQDAEVVCRELGCGAPSLLQGALYGEGQIFHCEGHESALMDCPRSSSGNTCSSGTAVELTCSEPVRLVGGASRCAGTVELRLRGEWRRVSYVAFPTDWDLKTKAVLCQNLDCGSAVSGEIRHDFPERPVWVVSPACVKKTSVLRECVRSVDTSSKFGLELVCSDSVRLIRGPSLCSGSLELRWDQSWTPVCEGDFDLQDAEVVCRELGCGAPSLLQGALYGEGQIFHCEGHESALMDCPRSSSGNTCSSGTAVELTCSEPVRLVGGASRCAGTVELRHRGEWRRVFDSNRWDLEATAGVCRDLDCGSAVSVEIKHDFPKRLVWRVKVDCVKTKSALRDCVWPKDIIGTSGLEVVCSDLLTRPTISLSVSDDGVSVAQPQGLSADGVSGAQLQGLQVLLGSDFSVRCSVEPQYPGGSFRLISPTVDPAQNHTLPAVNHSAHFLFSDAGPAHAGGYTCVYHLHVFSHNFSSQSLTCYLSIGEKHSCLLLLLIIVGLVLVLAPFFLILCRKRNSCNEQRTTGDLRRTHSEMVVYENVGLACEPEDSLYQSLCLDTRDPDHIYGDLGPLPQDAE